jgi:fatty acid desaturase
MSKIITLQNILIFFVVTTSVFTLSLYLISKSYIFTILVVIIFARTQIYFSEVLHESTHFNFIKLKGIQIKKIERFINIFLFPFLLTTIEQNRSHHFLHHNIMNSRNNKHKLFSDLDPDTKIYNPCEFNLKSFAQDFLGITTVKLLLLNNNRRNVLNEKGGGGDKKEDFNYFLKLISLFMIWSVIIFQKNGFIIFFCYAVSAICIYPLLSRIRIYIQHKNIQGIDVARNIKVSPLSMLFMSNMMSNHLSHHENPNLSYRDLEKYVQFNNIKKDSFMDSFHQIK